MAYLVVAALVVLMVLLALPAGKKERPVNGG